MSVKILSCSSLILLSFSSHLVWLKKKCLLSICLLSLSTSVIIELFHRFITKTSWSWPLLVRASLGRRSTATSAKRAIELWACSLFQTRMEKLTHWVSVSWNDGIKDSALAFQLSYLWPSLRLSSLLALLYFRFFATSPQNPDCILPLVALPCPLYLLKTFSGQGNRHSGYRFKKSPFFVGPKTKIQAPVILRVPPLFFMVIVRSVRGISRHTFFLNYTCDWYRCAKRKKGKAAPNNRNRCGIVKMHLSQNKL